MLAGLGNWATFLDKFFKNVQASSAGYLWPSALTFKKPMLAYGKKNMPKMINLLGSFCPELIKNYPE